MAQFSADNDYVDIKWLVTGDTAYARPGPAAGGANTITLSADHHTVTLDVDLQPLAAVGQPAPGPEHVSGTITCPEV
jgi:hypothetical protein